MKRFRSFLLLAFAAVLTGVVPLRAQMGGGGGDQPQTAFGTGRMVQGTVTAVAADQLTLRTENGELYKVVVTPNTQVRKERAQSRLTDIHAGDGIGAMGEIDRPGKTVHALMVYVVDAEQIKKARENLGKTYIAGKITAIDLDNLKLTVLRSDGVTQVIQVDEETSFKRGGRGMQQAMSFGFGGGAMPGAGQNRPSAQSGAAPSGATQSGAAANAGESITLADIKVGDLAGGPGALKNGTFIPTELSVATPGTRGSGRRRGEGPGANPPASPGTPQEPR